MGTRVPAAAPPLVPSPQRQGLNTTLIIKALLRARGPFFLLKSSLLLNLL